MKILSLLSVVVLSAFLVSGCASVCSVTEVGSTISIDKNLVARNYCAADVLINQAKVAPCLPTSGVCQPILVATVVDIDNLEHSSTFGRVTSENLSTRFTQRGFQVIEMKFSKSVYIKKDEGELVLTREITQLARDYNVQSVIVGTYAAGIGQVYVNVRMVKPDSNIIIAAFDYTVPYTSQIKSFLGIKDE